MHKGSSAVVLLASQLWRPMSKPEVVLKLSFDSELLATSMFFAIEMPFFEVHTLDMVGQSAFGVEHSNTLGITASQLWSVDRAVSSTLNHSPTTRPTQFQVDFISCHKKQEVRSMKLETRRKKI